MLVLSRRSDEEIVIGGTIRVTLLSIQDGQVRLGITAPRSVAVDRQEIHDRRIQMIEVIEQTADEFITV